jgi:2-methylcitrate dehydratase PrpD
VVHELVTGAGRGGNAVTAALARLGAFASSVEHDTLPSAVRERVQLMLLDVLGVTVAGARTPELRALAAAWAPGAGPAPVLGAGIATDPDAAAWLNGVAACCLELDEGNKHAQGHPAAHVVFAALAQAASPGRAVSGEDLLSAIVAGYEVAVRFGRATRRRPDLHTHGHWGAAGAGAAAARLRGLPADGVAAAIDAATGLVYATPWSVVLAGSFVRNLWAAGSNVSGLLGARLAAAGLSTAEGTPARTLGEVVGGFDPAPLTDGLGSRWDIAGGYFKRHASCSYTHPAADAVLELRDRHGFAAAEVSGVQVDTHRLSMPLAPLATGTRLAAMFSLPYVVAAAARYGRLGPEQFSAAARADPATLELAGRVQIRQDAELDARLPVERAVRVTVELADGHRYTSERPNPVGDADFHPFGAAQMREKLAGLIGAGEVDRIAGVVEALPAADDAAALLATLP